MFCSNCGKEILENTKFCVHCGAAQGGVPSQAQPPSQYTPPQQPSAQYYAPPQQPYVVPQPAAQKPKTGLKVGGIILTVLGGLAVVGSFSNGFYIRTLRYGIIDMSDIVTFGVQVALIVGGIVMICKSAKKK